jgi:hypothetical protein
MDLVSAVMAAFGLAVAAGLNAWIPVVLVGVAARWLPGGWIVLSPKFQFLSSDWFLLFAVVMLVIELLADKIPLVDHLNDLLQTVVRPVAGAVLFAVGAGVVHALDPRLALLLGFLTAGTVHGTKSLVRPMVTASTGGLGNPIVSLVEDVAAFVMTLLAILIPLALVAVFVLLALLAGRAVSRRPDTRPVP